MSFLSISGFRLELALVTWELLDAKFEFWSVRWRSVEVTRILELVWGRIFGHLCQKEV